MPWKASKRHSPRRRRGDAGSLRISAGTSSTAPPTVLDGDIAEWRAYFRAAITGTIAAQTKTPNPQLIARWSGTMADAAFTEALRRRRTGEAS